MVNKFRTYFAGSEGRRKKKKRASEGRKKVVRAASQEMQKEESRSLEEVRRGKQHLQPVPRTFKLAGRSIDNAEKKSQRA